MSALSSKEWRNDTRENEVHLMAAKTLLSPFTPSFKTAEKNEENWHSRSPISLHPRTSSLRHTSLLCLPLALVLVLALALSRSVTSLAPALPPAPTRFPTTSGLATASPPALARSPAGIRRGLRGWGGCRKKRPTTCPASHECSSSFRCCYCICSCHGGASIP